MAEFQEVMRNYNRMCESDETMCENCPLNKAIEEITDEGVRRKTSCPEYVVYFPDTAEEVIQRWAAEHPEKRKKTMLEVLKERFPKAKQYPYICPSRIFGDEDGAYDECEKSSCRDCWNRPAPDEYQEKDEL